MIKKIFITFAKDNKIRVAALLFLIVINPIVEMLSVSVVYPFVKYALNKSQDNDKTIAFFEKTVSQISTLDPRFIVGALALGLFTLKAVLGSITVRMVYTLVYLIEEHLSVSALKRYLFNDYCFSNQVSAPDLISKCIKAPSIFAHSTIVGFTALCSEIILFTIVLVVAVILKPVLAICLAFLSAFFGYLFIVKYKGQIEQDGILSVGQTEKCTTLLKDVVLAFKEIKISKTEILIIAKHNRILKIGSGAGKRYLIMQSLPRIWTECIGMATIVLCAMYLIAKRSQLAEMIPIVSTITILGLRLMPGISRIISAVTNIRFGMGAFRDVFKFINDCSQTTTAARNKDHIVHNVRLGKLAIDSLSIDSLSFRYNSNSNMIIDDLSAEVRMGEALAIIGPSGVGKSTLIDLLIGFQSPISGAIRANGIEIQNDLVQWQSLIGYVPQSVYFIEGTIRDNLLFGLPSTEVADSEIEFVLEECQILNFIRRLPRGLDTVVGDSGLNMSGGERQRIAIARALLKKPRVLILDEPISALDPTTQQQVINMILKLKPGRITIVVSHQIILTGICETVVRLGMSKPDDAVSIASDQIGSI